ncbi:helix-turn-helix domain-containing protein [Virgibacillus oceani]|uniref:HTH cro/C1-type domain-containing protein n=1 Tax=Virgibacillus oceani TaxID=1479511 RepID=A0A917HGG4_9BACI|nr:helix-turn-helix transcriptional regulator [Virgibacillus oceani]GGG78451.1 hypothetical protein GCM10011398_24620 [Virgibacillus oceani]
MKRIEKGLSIEKLANISGLNDKNIGRIERGEKLPTTFYHEIRD